jgi:hypothetical protein
MYKVRIISFMETWESTYNPTGWGPPSDFVNEKFAGLPFAEVSKHEKLGKFFDIFATSTGKRHGREEANASKEDDMGFTIVESKATIKAKKKANTGYVRKQPTTQSTYFHS